MMLPKLSQRLTHSMSTIHWQVLFLQTSSQHPVAKSHKLVAPVHGVDLRDVQHAAIKHLERHVRSIAALFQAPNSRFAGMLAESPQTSHAASALPNLCQKLVTSIHDSNKSRPHSLIITQFESTLPHKSQVCLPTLSLQPGVNLHDETPSYTCTQRKG